MGPEARAKSVAIKWRLLEVVAASVELFVFWKFLAVRDGFGLVVAVLFSLVVGGTYVLGSLFAAVTVPLGSQIDYFASLRDKMQS